jgi:HCOMODA/2-hydroxy-3-carboxy-muconic semialdehyde decarboxylase
VSASSSPTAAPADVVAAAHALTRHRLVTAYGHVSVRTGDSMLITPATALGDVSADELIDVPLSSTELPTGTPPEAWAHLATYRVRPDVGSVVRAMPPSAFAATAVVDELPILHGQSAWLGGPVGVHPSSTLLRTVELAEAMTPTLGDRHAVLLRGNGALTTGDHPGLAMARMQLLEVACRTWLDAAASGSPRPLPQAEIDRWRSTSGQLLPRLWHHLADGGA